MSLLRFILLAVVSLSAAFGVAGQSSTSQVVDVDEAGIRKSALKTVAPVFPEGSRKRGSKGVAVIQLEYDGKGMVVYTKVLESPDSELGTAIAAAVSRWEFKPNSIRGKPVNIRGKLTFYCVIDPNGTGRVQNPKQFR